jgi:putative ABC transport system substrate-binding protein
VNRRRFLLTSLAGVLAAPVTVEAQQGDQISRVGYLSPGSPSDPVRLRRFGAFRQGLRDLGHVEGQNMVIESRWAEGDYDRYPALAADLVRVKSKVIVAVGGAATQATQQATKMIPIVMSVVLDPVGSRFVASLARPEGNITGSLGWRFSGIRPIREAHLS